MEGKTGLVLADSQREAVRLALRSKALVITGGPGVGKTTLVNSILTVLRAKGVEEKPEPFVIRAQAGALVAAAISS